MQFSAAYCFSTLRCIKVVKFRMPWWSATRLNQKTISPLSTAHSKSVMKAGDSKKGLEVVLNYNSKESGVDTADQMLLDQVRLPKMAADRGYQSWQLYHFQGAPDFQQPKTRVSFITRWSPLPPELERKSNSHPAFELKDEKQTPPSLSLTRTKCRVYCTMYMRTRRGRALCQLKEIHLWFVLKISIQWLHCLIFDCFSFVDQFGEFCLF